MNHPNNSNANPSPTSQGSLILIIVLIIIVLVIVVIALVIWVIKHPRTVIIKEETRNINEHAREHEKINNKEQNNSTEQSFQELKDKILADNPHLTNLKTLDILVLTRIIEEHGGSILQKDLAKNCQFSKAKLSRLLREMEDRNLINRKPMGQSLLITLK